MRKRTNEGHAQELTMTLPTRHVRRAKRQAWRRPAMSAGTTETLREGEREYGTVAIDGRRYVVLGGTEADLLTGELSAWCVPLDQPVVNGHLNMRVKYFQPKDVRRRGWRYSVRAEAWL